MSGHRHIVVDGREWKYKCGRQSVVANAIDNNEKRCAGYAEVANMDHYAVEHDRHKRNFHLTPKQIADWLRK